MDFYFLLHFLVHDVHKVSVGWELLVGWELPLHGQTDIFGRWFVSWAWRVAIKFGSALNNSLFMPRRTVITTLPLNNWADVWINWYIEVR